MPNRACGSIVNNTFIAAVALVVSSSFVITREVQDSSSGQLVGQLQSYGGASSDQQHVVSDAHMLGKGDNPQPGFPGGKPPVHPQCTSIPGCRFCPYGPCTACYYDYGGSKFQLLNGICRCPPGFGNTTAAGNSDPQLPWWSVSCKPCRGGTFSIGGSILNAVCQRCEKGFTSLPASSSCTIRTDCRIGQQPNDRGNCVQCRIGAYQDEPSTGYCKTCPLNYTTVDTGSTSINDCIVPVCPAGQQLKTFTTGPNVGKVYWCEDCTGLRYSIGGNPDQGTDQPKCRKCTAPTVPTLDRASCAYNICPPPDVFEIDCTAGAPPAARTCPAAGVTPRKIYLPSLCTASPQGAVISWFKATSCTTDATTSTTVCAFNYNDPLSPPLANCPIDGINGDSDVYTPVITSFNGRTDCLCPVDEVNCRFVTGLNTQTDYKPFTTARVASDILILDA